MDAKTEEPPKPRRRVKKARGHGGHHGGAWKVAYADFVTAMMALFLVLWLVSQADTKLKQAIASYFRSPGVFDTQQGGILSGNKKVSKEPEKQDLIENEQALLGVAEALQKEFETKPEFAKAKDRVKIEVTDEGLRIQLVDKADRVSFASGSAELGDDAKSVLEEIAGGICSLPNKINIGGHTDARVFGSDNGYTNWELSTDRANAARRTLEANCVRPEQIRRVIGFADTELLVPGDPYSPANRRISITVLKLTEAPDPKELKKDKDQPEADPKPKNQSKIDPETSGETKLAKKKLETEGSVVVGEADKVPDKPKIK
ncbi:MAG: flagellar motor protein MotB [Pyrinomonadaceae bacterium]